MASVQASGFRREQQQPVRSGFQVAALDAQEQDQQPRRRSRRRAQPVTVCVVDALVLAVAVDMAGGDRSRVRILGPTTVLVENQPRRPQAHNP